MNLTQTQNMAYALPTGAKSPVGIRNLFSIESISSHLKGFFYTCLLWQIVNEHLRVAVLALCAVLRTRFRSAACIRNVDGRPQLSIEVSTMTKLIPFAQRFIAGTSTRTVSARKLHEFLNVKRDFTTWIKGRIKQYEFEENADYLAIHQKRGIGSGRGLTQYFITLDMAKELAMVERNEKGKQARRYFINCEKQLQEQKQLPAPKTDAVEDEAKYQMLNAMIKQMGFKSPPLVVPFTDMANLTAKLRGAEVTHSVMQECMEYAKHYTSKMKKLTGSKLLDN